MNSRRKSSFDVQHLRALCILVIHIALGASWVHTSRAAAPSAAWPLTWGDEFDGLAIDSSKWNWGSLPWGGQHHNDEYASWITPEDSYVANGSLWLRCRKAVGSEFGGYPYSEGFVHSNGRMRYKYGYAEIRARYPQGKGVWPAYWSLSDGWPPEFDIAEYFGSDNRMHMGLAYGVCCPATWDSFNLYNAGFQDWHTYALEWGPGYAIWYMDGIARKSIYASYVPAVSMYIILNSGMRWDADATTPFPNYYEVDYFRLYNPPSVIINDNDTGTGLHQFNYVGSWSYYNQTWGAFFNDNHWSSVATQFFQVEFSGTQVDLYGATAPNHGIAAISIDGGPETLVDYYAPTRTDKALIWSSPILSAGTHILKVRPTGTKNAASTGASVTADRLDVWGTPPPTPPPAPTNLTATRLNQRGKIRLAWTASSGATSYNVKRSTTSGGPYNTVRTGVTETSYTDGGLISGVTYYYVVSAVNSAGESANSNQAFATAR
jgi:beta-glucanase (GH16 family)